MSIRLLFVEPDLTRLRALQKTMQPLHAMWECRYSANADDALAQMSRVPCDLLIADLLVAREDGTKLLAVAGAKHPQTIRVGFVDAGNQLELGRANPLVHQYLPKSAELPVIREAVQNAFALKGILSGKKLQEIIGRVHKLPGLPTLYLDILKELRSSEPSLQQVGQLIARDTNLSAQVLKLVNSATYSVRNRITTPAHAISMMGLDAIAAVVLTIDIFAQYDRLAALVPDFSLSEYQEHCTTVAQYAATIAKAKGWTTAQGNEASMAGLLHDTGKLVLAENFPKEYAQVLGMAADKDIADWVAEWTVFGTTHAEVGAYLLGLWGISGRIVRACAFHHDPSADGESGLSPAALLHIADAFDREPDLEQLGRVKGRANPEFLRAEKLDSLLPAWRTACPPRKPGAVVKRATAPVVRNTSTSSTIYAAKTENKGCLGGLFDWLKR